MRRLIIANKAYSSWSLRAWLALKAARLAFVEEVIPLGEPDTASRIGAHSPSGKVPCLVDGGVAVWESLAICEYAADQSPEARLWPADPVARAVARAASCEMHAGFLPLRRAMPFNCRKALPGRGWPDDSGERAQVAADVARLDALWCDLRRRFGQAGPFLFGGFTNADCMFAPVASRFHTYGVTVSPQAAAYVAAVMDHPLMRQWVAEAHAEPWVLPRVEL